MPPEGRSDPAWQSHAGHGPLNGEPTGTPAIQGASPVPTARPKSPRSSTGRMSSGFCQVMACWIRRPQATGLRCPRRKRRERWHGTLGPAEDRPKRSQRTGPPSWPLRRRPWREWRPSVRRRCPWRCRRTCSTARRHEWVSGRLRGGGCGSCQQPGPHEWRPSAYPALTPCGEAEARRGRDAV